MNKLQCQIKINNIYLYKYIYDYNIVTKLTE